MYYSAYDPSYLTSLAARLGAVSAHAPAWCIFDNTTLGAAAENALDLTETLTGLSAERAMHWNP
jgi:uncharacterized protein YecE (DUF72 family)